MGVCFTYIETRRLIIRDIQTEDAAPFAEMAADGSLAELGLGKDCRSWIAGWIAEARELAGRDNPRTSYLAYAITLKEENTVVGSVGCSYYEDLQETGITYFIGAQYRNNGYAAEAATAYIRYFFRHYPISKLIATVRAENIAPRKTIEKAGFLLTEKKMYRDVNDSKEHLYHFYALDA